MISVNSLDWVYILAKFVADFSEFKVAEKEDRLIGTFSGKLRRRSGEEGKDFFMVSGEFNVKRRRINKCQVL